LGAEAREYALDSVAATSLFQASAGNPLFIVEMVRAGDQFVQPSQDVDLSGGQATAPKPHAGLPPSEVARLAWVVALGAALAWGVLAAERAAVQPASARLPRLLLALVAVLSLAEAARAALAATLGPRLALDAGAEAVARSAVLVALVLGLAWLAQRGEPELVWLVYTLVALGAVKLLLHDVRAGRPATLVASLGLYGSLLILLPRLAKPRARSR
jgi:hypothetical protein